jgi:hypothetical protein
LGLKRLTTPKHAGVVRAATPKVEPEREKLGEGSSDKWKRLDK